MGSQDIGDLLIKVSEGDGKAFSLLFHRYKDLIYSIALKYTKSAIYAEEVVQDVFLRIWRNRHNLLAVEQFDAWIRVIARNRSLSVLEQIVREERNKEKQYHYIPPGGYEAGERVTDLDMQKLLGQALTLLTQRQREIFVRCRLENVPREQVAEELGLSPATVSVHLTIALRTVRAFLTSQLRWVLLITALSY